MSQDTIPTYVALNLERKRFLLSVALLLLTSGLMLTVLTVIGYTHYEVKRQIGIRVQGLLDENAALKAKLEKSEQERELLEALFQIQAHNKANELRQRQLLFPPIRWDAGEQLMRLPDFEEFARKVNRMEAERGPMPREVNPLTNSNP